MVLVKVLTSIAMHGFPSCTVLELDDAEAKSLIACGFAVASSEPAANVERVAAPMTTAPVVETADAPAAVETADVAPARKAPARKRAPKSDD